MTIYMPQNPNSFSGNLSRGLMNRLDDDRKYKRQLQRQEEEDARLGKQIRAAYGLITEEEAAGIRNGLPSVPPPPVPESNLPGAQPAGALGLVQPAPASAPQQSPQPPATIPGFVAGSIQGTQYSAGQQQAPAPAPVPAPAPASTASQPAAAIATKRRVPQGLMEEAKTVTAMLDRGVRPQLAMGMGKDFAKQIAAEQQRVQLAGDFARLSTAFQVAAAQGDKVGAATAIWHMKSLGIPLIDEKLLLEAINSTDKKIEYKDAGGHIEVFVSDKFGRAARVAQIPKSLDINTKYTADSRVAAAATSGSYSLAAAQVAADSRIKAAMLSKELADANPKSSMGAVEVYTKIQDELWNSGTHAERLGKLIAYGPVLADVQKKLGYSDEKMKNDLRYIITNGGEIELPMGGDLKAILEDLAEKERLAGHSGRYDYAPLPTDYYRYGGT